MNDYIEYITTIKQTMKYIRERINSDITKSAGLFGLPIGLSKPSLEKYMTLLENDLMEAIFVHAYSKVEQEIFQDIQQSIGNIEIVFKNGYKSNYVLKVEKLVKSEKDLDKLAAALELEGKNYLEISKYKILRDFIAHGKRFKKNEIINKIDLYNDIENIISTIAI